MTDTWNKTWLQSQKEHFKHALLNNSLSKCSYLHTKKKDGRILSSIYGSPITFYLLQLFPCKDMDITAVTSQLKVQSVPWLYFSLATEAFHAAAQLEPHMLLLMKHKTSAMLAPFLCCSKTQCTRDCDYLCCS